MDPIGNFIRNGDFCEVVSDKFVEHGVKRGHVVYVAGHKALPISENDPYTQRIKLLVHIYNDHTFEMGKELYLMDPNSLSRLDDYDQEHFLADYRRANGIN